MKILKIIGIVALSLIFSQLLVQSVSAGALNSGIIDHVAGNLDANAGGEFGDIASYLAIIAIPFVNVIAILAVIIAGAIMTVSQNDEQATQARRTFIGSAIAIALVNIAAPIRNAIISSDGTGIIQNPNIAAAGIENELAGIINWIQMPLATVAVLMIIISGFRAVINFGTDEGLVQLRRTVFSVVAGITLIAIKLAFVDAIVISGRPGRITSTIVGIINVMLSFMGLAAVVVVVIAGFFMILNVGNDDQYRKARDLILRVGIGLLVIMASAALINIVFIGTAG